ncbi:hypothetical protein KIPB_003103 [Kipferlia bialata]|uniref:Shq1 C-terminal domain-containing protein n=1 Tax=Kipferlia bialata TaxID=797122 RepID=A0A9K3GGT0_9EUKA|nr:hypothetical protein KIPB_003103 [Kipferlia bialata]|eukprot:g3103.t1
MDEEYLTQLIGGPGSLRGAARPTPETVEALLGMGLGVGDISAAQTEGAPPQPAPASVPYGFNGMFSGAIGSNTESICLRYPEQVSVRDRVKERLSEEDARWDPEQYVMSSVYDKATVDAALSYTPFFRQRQEGASLSEDMAAAVGVLSQQWPEGIEISDPKAVLCTLVDVLYAFCRCVRVTQGAVLSTSTRDTDTVWDMVQASPCLSHLDASTHSVKRCLAACVRRCCIVSQVPSVSLGMACISDVQGVLSRGRVCILHCLLEMHGMLADPACDPPLSIHNTLWTAPLIAWVAQSGEDVLASLAQHTKKVKLTQAQASEGLDLASLDVYIQQMLAEMQ